MRPQPPPAPPSPLLLAETTPEAFTIDDLSSMTDLVLDQHQYQQQQMQQALVTIAAKVSAAAHTATTGLLFFAISLTYTHTHSLIHSHGLWTIVAGPYFQEILRELTKC